jgi:hypothetical protein
LHAGTPPRYLSCDTKKWKFSVSRCFLDILRLKVGSLELTSVAWADVMLFITKKSTHKNLTPGFDEILPSFPRVFIIPCVMGHPVANKKKQVCSLNRSAGLKIL